LVADARAATGQYRAALVDLEQMLAHSAGMSPVAAKDHAAKIRAKAIHYSGTL
jgi:hypothetical protein